MIFQAALGCDDAVARAGVHCARQQPAKSQRAGVAINIAFGPV